VGFDPDGALEGIELKRARRVRTVWLMLKGEKREEMGKVRGRGEDAKRAEGESCNKTRLVI